MFRMTKKDFVVEMIINLFVAIAIFVVAMMGFVVNFALGIVCVVMATAAMTVKVMIDVMQYSRDKEEA